MFKIGRAIFYIHRAVFKSNPIHHLSRYKMIMGRNMKPERVAAFQRLVDTKLYTASQVADLARFEGTQEEQKKKRQNFRSALNGYYRPEGDPIDFVRVKGQGFQAAWLGSDWKMTAGQPEP